VYRDEDETDANPNFLRGLLRTAFIGQMPPHGLLEVAIQRFAKSIRPKSDERASTKAQRLRQLHALAALIKLVLTHGKGDNMIQETLNPHQRQPSYLCGRLLAVLAEAQRRASGSPLNRTLLDRFYGSVSTAPGAFLPMLIKRTITDHLPKIRRENRGHAQLNSLIQELAKGIDDGGGFPQTLSLFQQGAFVLGFYQQRAALTYRPEQGNTDSTSKEEVPIDTH
jgi:CRISPR-associated protein Csd1